MNKCHDEKKITMAKLQPYFAKTLERIKSNQEIGENYWFIHNL